MLDLAPAPIIGQVLRKGKSHVACSAASFFVLEPVELQLVEQFQQLVFKFVEQLILQLLLELVEQFQQLVFKLLEQLVLQLLIRGEGVRKLILRNFLSPGDVVMLTAAVRDLHRRHPGKFLTDVRTPCPQLWENNPHLTPLDEEAPDVETIDCHYPLIHESNRTPHHFIHGFAQFLGAHLGVEIRPAEFKGDVHVSDLEKSWFSRVRELAGEDVPFWIVVSGGKYDFTCKWWDPARWQQVVDHFRDRILFVQVGEEGHHHPPIEGAINLVGKTDLRQLVRLVYHAQGVLAPVSLLMHLAAAVEVKGGRPKNRPCVVVAGGREPPQWEAYPHHQFIHTNGALLCCDDGGCWKARVVPLGDGHEADKPENLCVDVVGGLPRCMDMIPAAEVIHRIELYFKGGAIRTLTPRERDASRAALQVSENSVAAPRPRG